MPDTPRLWAAASVLLAWLGLSAWALLRSRGRGEPAGADSALLVVHASQIGFAEDLARRCAEALRLAQPGTGLAALGTVDAAVLAAARQVLFVVSTTGEGDAPDSAARFVTRVMGGGADLGHLRYGLLALGDRGYAQFCAFGRSLDAWLRRNGATPLFDPIEVDDGDEDALQDWHRQLGRLAGAELTHADRFSPWRLVERRLLNPGSTGSPVFHLALEPKGEMPAWSAGDIAEIRPGRPPGLEAHRLTALPHRDYSIASLPRDGRLELLVRRMQHPDGTPGLGSGWLTQGAPLGGPVDLCIRTNRAFHPPDPTRPLILVGNGTGLAGLRAHLRARRAAGARPNWLVFGERMRAHDALHGAELEAMLAEGTLQRLDLVFSRDQPQRRYVQDALRDAAPELRWWVAEGAAILVSGSLAGMSTGVQAALVEVLGEAEVQALTEAGRYRRDVY